MAFKKKTTLTGAAIAALFSVTSAALLAQEAPSVSEPWAQTEPADLEGQDTNATSEAASAQPVQKSSRPRVSKAERLANLTPEEATKQRFLFLLKNNPEILSAEVNKQAAQYGKDAAKAGYYPKLSIGANSATSSTVTNTQSTAVTVRQPIYTGGRISARVSAAEDESGIALSTASKTVQDVILDAMLAHTQLSRLSLLVEASRSAVNAVTDLLALEERRVELGGGGVTDAQFAKARLSVAVDRLANFEGQLDEARASYFRYFGAYPEGYSIPELEVPARMLPPSVEKAVQTAAFGNPQLKIAELQITKAKHNYDAEFASLFPSLDIVGVHQRYRVPDVISQQTSNNSIGLSLSYNAFSGGEQTARVGQAASNIETQKATLYSTRLKIEENVRFQWGRQIASYARARSLDDASRDALSVFKNRKRLRDFGRETAIAMLDAQVEYYNVLISYINAVFDGRTAAIRLVHAMGQLQPSEEPATWFAQFFSPNPERNKLATGLLAPQEIARTRTDKGSANQLGIKVDEAAATKAGQFFLTPDEQIRLRPKGEGRVLPKVSEEESKARPALKPTGDLDMRFYR